jgi:hypothetical protein
MRQDPSGGPARLDRTVVPGITGLRFLPQRTEATLVNISPSGVLVETAEKYRVGSETSVMFEGGFTPPTARGRIVRCEVAVMGRDGVLRYHIAIEFDSPLTLGAALEDSAPAPASAAAAVRNRW